MTLPPGTQVGPYRVVAPLGEGGMGVVYRARDGRLNRDVALKVLPASAQGDPGRQRRMELEARAAGGLSHPNILTVYDVGVHEGAPFLVAELLEGATLRERLDAAGALPAQEALDLAAQAARGLAAAHERGIVHRDLKPENLFVTREGRVKILDFGLAKSSPGGADDPARDATLPAMTETGAVLGTVGYMAPEQVQGLPADARADVFSLGAVLYEMLSGRRAFGEGSPVERAYATLKDAPPPLASLRPELPPSSSALVERCLAKDPAARFPSARELCDALDGALGELAVGAPGVSLPPTPPPAPPVPASPAPRPRRRWLALLPPVALAGAFAATRLLPRARERPSPAPAATAPRAPVIERLQQLTSDPGPELWPCLSPDGNTFVYASRASGNWDLYSQRVGGENPMNLTAGSPEDDTHPAFSPDGELLAFRSERDGGGLFVMGATGESVRRVSDFGYFPRWSPDGGELVVGSRPLVHPSTPYQGSEVWAVTVATGERRRLAPRIAQQPAVSPRGRRVAYWGVEGGARHLSTVAASGGDAVRLFDAPSLLFAPAWSPDGRFVYFASDRAGSMNLWRAPVDEESGRGLGPPEPVTNGAGAWVHSVHFARDGARAVFVAGTAGWVVERLPFDPVRGVVGAPVRVGFGSFPNAGVDQVVFQVDSGSRRGLMIVGADGRSRRWLTATSGPHLDRYPVWSPGGREIVFASNRGGRMECWSIHPDGGGLRQLTRTGGGEVRYCMPSPDGRRMLVVTRGGLDGIYDLARPFEEQQPVPFPPGDGGARSCPRSGRPTGVGWSASWCSATSRSTTRPPPGPASRSST